ncbi:MAG: hypothetical protein U9R79_18145 [Armatimonadota bacterium]|nr:hypothetical protein [Armatimonadota bacterium]
MSEESGREDQESPEPPHMGLDADDGVQGAGESAGQVDLERPLQTRNAAIFAATVSLIYLAAPVLYIGFTQAALLERLGASKTVANLPSTAYLSMAPMTVIAAWLIPQARLLRKAIAVSFFATAAVGGVVAAVLVLPGAKWDGLRIASLLVHAIVVGIANGVIWSFNWEALARGVSEGRRGTALTLAYGVGPVFAVIGSLGSQLVLTNEVFRWTPALWRPISYPWSFALLFGASLPMMALAGYLALLYIIPIPRRDAQRQPFRQGVLGGLGRFVGYRLIIVACLGYLVVYSAHMVQNNMVLYTQEVVSLPSETLVGYQNALRFACKVIGGLILGWILVRTSALTCMAITTVLDALGVLWILFARGMSFLFAFGLNGAGELFGVYYPNYIVSCSPKAHVRRNMAFLRVIQTPVAAAPALFGWIADTWSLRTSFWVSLAVMAATLIWMLVALPAHPRPRAEDLAEAEQESLDPIEQ